MVAGATGVDFALLVIAADEGVMPQTREHLAVLSLLAVRGGVVALTKCVLVDDDWLALVEEDVRAALAGSLLADAPIVRVSATTGAGLAELKGALTAAALGAPRQHEDDLFRLPIDRAFTVRGTGSVVTGTVWSGVLDRDAALRLLPGDESVRVRGLQAHGHSVARVQAGERAAIALQGVDIDRLARGGMLVQGDAWRASRVLRADVTLLADAPAALGPRRRVRLHVGTADVEARLVRAGGPIEPGTITSARVVLDEPIVARAGDRFVLRDSSPARTIGGGVVVDPVAPPRAKPWPLDDRTPATLLQHLLRETGALGVAVSELPVRLGVPPSQVGDVIAASESWRVGNRLLGRDTRAALENQALRTVAEFHARQPLEAGAPQQWLRSRLPAPDDVAAAVVLGLEAQGGLVAEQGSVRLPGHAARLSAAEESLKERLLAALDACAGEPPTLDELAGTLGASADSLGAVARLLARDGSLVAVEPARFYRAETVQGLVARLIGGMTPETGYGPAELRDLLGFSRKYLIPFLEYCDRVGITRRDLDGKRRLVVAARTVS
jgi:selenocysteine-specific elongation factor